MKIKNDIQITSNEKAREKGCWRFTALILVILLPIIWSCDKLFTDFGPQPIFSEKEKHHPMLNVFGVLRPDDLNGMPMSFVHLEESFSVYTDPDTLLISDAQVKIYKLEQGAVCDSIDMEFTSYNQLFETQAYRHPTFVPEPGCSYRVVCRKDGYPDLTSKTTIPRIPRILNPTIHPNERMFTFAIEHDSLAGLYDCYLQVGDTIYSKPVRRAETGNTDVQFNLDDFGDDGSGALFVYAYDTKLSEYKTYNITIKPNSYRTHYSTVENGYGCFGSLNIRGIPLSF